MREIKFRWWNGQKIIDHENIQVQIKNLKNMDNLMQFTGFKDSNGTGIYEGDRIYLAGYGTYEVIFPFIELYEAGAENDIGAIIGNIYETSINT